MMLVSCLLLHILGCFLLSLITLGFLQMTGLEELDKVDNRFLGFFPLATLGAALSTIPGGRGWSQTFYLMLCILGVSSIQTTLSIPSSLFTKMPSLVKRRLLQSLLVILCLLPSLVLCTATGPSLLLILQRWSTDLPILILASMISAAIGWLHGVHNLCSHVSPELPKLYIRYLQFSCGLAPLVFMFFSVRLAITPLNPGPLMLPPWASHIGVILASFSVVQLPLGVMFALVYKGVKRMMIDGAVRTEVWAEHGNSRQKLFDRDVITTSYRNFEQFDGIDNLETPLRANNVSKQRSLSNSLVN